MISQNIQLSNLIWGNLLPDSFTRVHVLESHQFISSSLDLFRTIDIFGRDALIYLNNLMDVIHAHMKQLCLKYADENPTEILIK